MSTILFFKFVVCMYMSVLLVCLYHVHAWYLRKTEDGVRAPGAGLRTVTAMWVLGIKASHLDEQPMVLTSEPPLQSPTVLDNTIFKEVDVP